jgi:hypothetical protein
VGDHAFDGQSRAGRWLGQRRFQIALWIAVIEGILVLVTKDWSKYTVIIVAIPIILFYIFAGRTLESDAGRQLSWIAGASQALAVIGVILVLVLKWLLLAAVIAIAVLALVFLFADRPGRRPSA